MTGGTPPTDVLPASQVAELINSLAKALRAYHMYLPNNPIYQRASDNLRVAFLIVSPFSFIGAAVLFRARRFLDEDMQKIMMAVLVAMQEEQERKAAEAEKAASPAETST